MVTEKQIYEVVARERIRQVLFRYCRAIDRRDRNLLRSIYWPDARESRGSDYSGDQEGFIDWVFSLLSTMERTQHFIGNTLIDINGDIARSEAYFRAYHRIKTGPEVYTDEFVSGRYIDRFECRSGEWRIAARSAALDWFRSEEGQDSKEEGFRGRGYGSGRSNPGDPSDHLFNDRAFTPEHSQ